MIDNRLTSGHLPNLSTKQKWIVSSRYPQGIVSPQEAICEFLIFIVKTWSPEAVLSEFQELFIRQADADEFALECLTEIILKNQKSEFDNLLRRCCYILINNWNISRNHSYISRLIHLFDESSLYEKTDALILGRLRNWIRSFIASSDFETLKLVTTRCEDGRTWHWSQRYTPYLLASQYANLNNPLEQRQFAQKVSRQLKDQFKFELAMYTARSESGRVKLKGLKNPTSLGDEVLRLIKTVVIKRGTYSYPNLAKIFLQQTQDLDYEVFKKSLLEYLFFGIELDEFSKRIKGILAAQLETLYVNYHDKRIDEALLLRTVKRLAESLTADRNGELSSLFSFLSLQQSPLMLVILLLKLTLICRYVKTHIEVCIANVVRCYEDYQEEDCVWVIQFLELFTIISTIYSENVEYSLVNMQGSSEPQYLRDDVESHRIFSLQRYVASRLR
ncbi:MAG: hypothetical protein KME11_02935 [Timaviella obliquedivisa GSE-PSE-MK23-08B]|jgi:hypothetical protein|nr:hypothetical protein [Timaviella obliquedivisa GSE-PSE-MK23-08B]